MPNYWRKIQKVLSHRQVHTMKKIDFPLWSDTVFSFFALLLFSFCIFRFYLSALWAALLAAGSFAAAATVLLHLWRRARHRKKYGAENERSNVQKLAFHLAMDSPQNNAELIAKSLSALHEAKNSTSDSPADNTQKNCAENKTPYAQIKDQTVRTQDGDNFLKFQFEKVTADELCPVIRTLGEHKTVYAAGFTDEACKLAESFGVTLKDANDVYSLVKESGCMPEHLIEPPKEKNGFKEKFAFRIRKSAWRGYAFSGAFLLLFSLITIFPVYYIISGGVLLLLSALIRFFGKKE